MPDSRREDSSYKSLIESFDGRGITHCSALLARYDEFSDQERLLAMLTFRYAKYEPARGILLKELRSDRPERSGMAAAAYGRMGGDESLTDLLTELENPTGEAHVSNILSALVLYGETTRHADICETLVDLIGRGGLSSWNLSLAIEALALAAGHLDRNMSLFQRSTGTIGSMSGHPSRDVAETVEFALRHLSNDGTSEDVQR